MSGRLRFSKVLGFTALPITSISSLWVQLELEQGMNVIQALDILHLAAISATRWTKLLWARASKIDHFRHRYTPALTQDISKKDKKSQDTFSHVTIRKELQIAF
jgi:hypothetical protein